MWRCLKYPACLQSMLERQAEDMCSQVINYVTMSYNFATFNVSAFIIHDPWKAFNVTVQRSVPHWTSTGEPDSWDGWIWSYGNGCGTQYTLLAKHVLCSCLVMFFHVVCSRFLHIFIVWMFFMFVFKTINLQDVLVPRAR